MTDSGSQEDVPPALLPKPLSFDELNTALAGAQEEVKSLRQQYDELQAFVSKRFGAAIPDRAELRSDPVNTDKLTPGNSGGGSETRDTGSQVRPSSVPVSPPPSDIPPEIANVSGNEAKRALSVGDFDSCKLATKRKSSLGACPFIESLAECCGD